MIYFQVGTIMRYLLDELMSYEEGYSDMLMRSRAPERHETFMGASDPTDAPSKADILLLYGIIERQGVLISQMQQVISCQSSCSCSPEASPQKSQVIAAR
jgi:hypothetical protein